MVMVVVNQFMTMSLRQGMQLAPFKSHTATQKPRQPCCVRAASNDPYRGKSGAFAFNVPLYMSARWMDFKTLDCTVLVSLGST